MNTSSPHRADNDDEPFPEPTMSYDYSFGFEQSWDVSASTVFQRKYWWLSIVISVVYVALFKLGQRQISNPVRHVDRALFMWNTLLAVFSLLGAVRMWPELIFVIRHHGLVYSVCNRSFALQVVTGFWTEMFGWSKAPELLDTLFLVLKKRPVIFLHWFHHVTVLIYVWHACKDHTAAGRWFITMNYTVHAVMYGYFALKAIKFPYIPSRLPQLITTMQIVQMIVGVIITGAVLKLKLNGVECRQTWENLYFCLFIYSTYMLLFVKFFADAYILRRRKQDDARKCLQAATSRQEKEKNKGIKDQNENFLISPPTENVTNNNKGKLKCS